jgi:hypothetical protein
MLSIDHVRDLLGNPALSDDEVAIVRDACTALAESIIDACEHRCSEPLDAMQKDQVASVPPAP